MKKLIQFSVLAISCLTMVLIFQAYDVKSYDDNPNVDRPILTPRHI